MEKIATSKAAKWAKRARRNSTVTSLLSKNIVSNIKDESCSKIRPWHIIGNTPKYDALEITSFSHRDSNPNYPIGIKLTNTPNSFIILAAFDTGIVKSNRVDVIELTKLDTGSYFKRIITSLSLTYSSTHTFNDWQGTGKQLHVHIRDINYDSSWHAVVELNYNNAVPNDSMTNLIISGYQGWFAYPGDGAPINK